MIEREEIGPRHHAGSVGLTPDRRDGFEGLESLDDVRDHQDFTSDVRDHQGSVGRRSPTLDRRPRIRDMVPQDFLVYIKYTCPVRTDPLLQSGVLVLVLVFVRVCRCCRGNRPWTPDPRPLGRIRDLDLRPRIRDSEHDGSSRCSRPSSADVRDHHDFTSDVRDHQGSVGRSLTLDRRPGIRGVVFHQISSCTPAKFTPPSGQGVLCTTP